MDGGHYSVCKVAVAERTQQGSQEWYPEGARRKRSDYDGSRKSRRPSGFTGAPILTMTKSRLSTPRSSEVVP